MPEENKGNPSAPESPVNNSAAETPATKPAAEASAETAPKPAAPAAAAATPPKPATPPTAAKPAAPGAPAAANPAVPAKPAGPVPEPWNAVLPNGLKNRFGSAIKEANTYVGQNYLVVDKAVVLDVLHILRDEEQFDYCVDLTAVHYPKKDDQFEIVWILYSFAKNERVRVKTQVKDGEAVPTSTKLWPTANWLERECYDMFGIQFTGHPDMRRILLPDGWNGFPLRKDYGIYQQDKDWVQANLGIESGQ